MRAPLTLQPSDATASLNAGGKVDLADFLFEEDFLFTKYILYTKVRIFKQVAQPVIEVTTVRRISMAVVADRRREPDAARQDEESG